MIGWMGLTIEVSKSLSTTLVRHGLPRKPWNSEFLRLIRGTQTLPAGGANHKSSNSGPAGNRQMAEINKINCC